MRNYRIVKDNYLGYEAQVKYAWFPFAWFQMHDFYWINTWSSAEQAKHFIQQKKAGAYNYIQSDENESEYEREVKLLVFQAKNFLPEVVWNDSEAQGQEQNSRRWWPVLNFR